MEKPKKMVGDRFGFDGGFDSPARVGKMVPVCQHRRHNRQEPFGNFKLILKTVLRFQATQHRATGPKHVHRM